MTEDLAAVVEKAISSLAKQASITHDQFSPLEKMQLAQTALNLANALRCLTIK